MPIVKAVHGLREVRPDPDFEQQLAEHLRATNERPALLELYARFAHGAGPFDLMMRRAVLRAIARSVVAGYGGASPTAPTSDLPRTPSAYAIVTDGAAF